MRKYHVRFLGGKGVAIPPTYPTIILKNGEHVDVDRLERPQLFLDENDDPIVLYSACSITPLNQKKDGSSFNIQIPVLCSSGNPVTRFPR